MRNHDKNKTDSESIVCKKYVVTTYRELSYKLAEMRKKAREQR
jgi:hypothetical protein